MCHPKVRKRVGWKRGLPTQHLRYGPISRRQDRTADDGRPHEDHEHGGPVEADRPRAPVDRRAITFARHHKRRLEDCTNQAEPFSASSSARSSSRVTFFSVTLASSRIKSTTLSSKIGAR